MRSYFSDQIEYFLALIGANLFALFFLF